MKIKITYNGPYIVSGGIPLSEKRIAEEGGHYKLEHIRDITAPHDYALCRCGRSGNPPFCDGSHLHTDFDGAETAPRNTILERAEIFPGKGIDLLDDESLCALARFCHTDDGTVWDMLDESDDPEICADLIKAACECPAGRLVAYDKTGNAIEPEYEPAIEIYQDPERNVSGPIVVKGGIPLESSDGYVYEIRNRMALCRCGKSYNKPFCDATHAAKGYKDRKG